MHISVDADKPVGYQTVTFGAGNTYTQLINALKDAKLALPNLPSLPHLNVVGSVITGTHGSGANKASMATYVSEIAFVDPNGNARRLTRKDGGLEFKRYLHSFGTLGIIYEMTMDVRPEFGVTKCIYKDVPWSQFLHKKKEFKKLNEDFEFLSYFTNWQEEKMNSIWVGREHINDKGDFSAFYEMGDY